MAISVANVCKSNCSYSAIYATERTIRSNASMTQESRYRVLDFRRRHSMPAQQCLKLCFGIFTPIGGVCDQRFKHNRYVVPG